MDKTPKGPITLTKFQHSSRDESKLAGHFVFIEDENKSAASDVSPGLHTCVDGRGPSAFKSSIPGKALSMKSKKGSSSLPPTLQVTPCVNHTFRFANPTAASVTISVGNIAGALGGICTVVNSKVTMVATSFKIRKITVWSSASSSAASNVVLDWAAGSDNQVPDESKIRSIPEGITETGALVFMPPKNSLAGFWIIVTAGVVADGVFSLALPAGSIVDLLVDYRTSNVFPAQDATVIVGVLKTFYYLALDGPGSNKLPPLGLPTTA